MALAKTIVSKANFLLLDEPTNHLDMHSCELLVEALNKYEGSLILVSHDRYFISKTANKIWEIVDQKIREFKGTYDEWVIWKEAKEKEKEKQTVKAEEKPKPTPVPDPVVQKPINKEQKKELQKQQRLFQKAEEDIAKLKAEKARLEADLASPEFYGDRNKFQDLEKRYKEASNRLIHLEREYETIFERLMELE